MSEQNRILEKISISLDISPSDYKRAQERFTSVGNWLKDGTYHSGNNPKIYLQGSFRLGTVVKPYRGDKEGSFDIDQVCELIPSNIITPAKLKSDIGDRLKAHSDYNRMLDKEGKRCWTIEYATDDSRPGFHIDVLPSVTSKDGTLYQIDITHKDNEDYLWLRSNPNGYYYWFKSKNSYSSEFFQREIANIFEMNRQTFITFDDVPRALIRTPLQRSIQILKRHRDVYFSKKEGRPASIIITTISAHLEARGTIEDYIKHFIDYVLSRHEEWLSSGTLPLDGILDFENGNWIISNPADKGMDKNNVENFADKWNKDKSLPIVFFEWVLQLQRDFGRFIKTLNVSELNMRSSSLPSTTVTYSELVKKEIDSEKSKNLSSNRNLLQLIHLGIEGKVDWSYVKAVAQHEYEMAETEDSKNVATVNFYQVALHRGLSLSDQAKDDLRAILQNNMNNSRYVLCCNILLGTATFEMIRRCAYENPHEGILAWPIIRLFKPRHLIPDYSSKRA